MVEIERSQPDAIHGRLKSAIEVPTRAHLWIPAHEIEFVPALLPLVYGDGLALFVVGTIHQRPKWWVIRGDSAWHLELDYPGQRNDDPLGFGDLLEDGGILDDMEEHFGRANCGYCGQGLSMYSGWEDFNRCGGCDQDGCDAEECFQAGSHEWPAVNANDGCHWGRMLWPADFPTINHPLDRRGNLLRPTESQVTIAIDTTV